MGLTKLRRKLALEARGDVLEVSIGTGRNLDFYDWSGEKGSNKKKTTPAGEYDTAIKSFTGLDKSAQMLDIAQRKFSATKTSIPTRWVVQDATAQPLPPSPSQTGKYDTILSTMSLCSVSDPAALLHNLSSALEPSGGRILLLEHGRGRWQWLNRILDNGAAGHAEKFGCWWNRDLGVVIEEATKQTGLEIVQVKRKHGGTTWWVELRKRSDAAPTQSLSTTA